MEDLWRVQDSGIDIDELADSAGFKLLLARFRAVEEQSHHRTLLFQEKTSEHPLTGDSK